MTYPYCLPIIKANKAEITATIRQYKSEYAYFEVWLDYVDGLDGAFVKQLDVETKGRLVVVFRRQQLEPIKLSLPQRFEMLDLLQGTSALVDLDISTQQAEIDYISKRQSHIRTIISYHNYKETPPDDALNDIVQQIRKKNPTILKIATDCQKENDSLRLLKLLLALRGSNQQYIVSGMGQKGLVTRIFGALWGNALIFAPASAEEQSAPGQLTRKQLDNVLQTIGE